MNRFSTVLVQLGCLITLGGSAIAGPLVEASVDPVRKRGYAKIEAESARLITRSDKAHPAYDPKNLKGPSLHYEVMGPDLPASITMPGKPSGGKALFNTGTGEQSEDEAQRNHVYLPHEAPPLGTIAEYRVRFREPGTYELFIKLAYWESGSTSVPAHWAEPTNAEGVGAIHVNDFADGRRLNSSWWRRHNNSAWGLSSREWKVVDFGPALNVLPEDLNEQGYADVVWQISASHPGLIIDSFVLYQGYHIDASVSKFEQAQAFEALPMSRTAVVK